jgi:hypothetical protein
VTQQRAKRRGARQRRRAVCMRSWERQACAAPPGGRHTTQVFAAVRRVCPSQCNEQGTRMHSWRRAPRPFPHRHAHAYTPPTSWPRRAPAFAHAAPARCAHARLAQQRCQTGAPAVVSAVRSGRSASTVRSRRGARSAPRRRAWRCSMTGIRSSPGAGCTHMRTCTPTGGLVAPPHVARRGAPPTPATHAHTRWHGAGHALREFQPEQRWRAID